MNRLTIPRFAVVLLLWSSIFLSSCTVYAPMQPTVSTITKTGQVEATAGIQLSGRLEGNAVYSPLPHVLLAAGGTYRPNYGSVFHTQQWEASLGSYVPFTNRLQATGLLGYGRARTERSDYDIVAGNTSFTDNTRYQKLFGQVGLNYLRSRYAFGCVYRYTRLQLDYLYTSHYNRNEPADIDHSHRHEVLGYARCGFGFLPPKWQLQFSVGLSASPNLRQLTSQEDPSGAVERFERPTFLLGAGLVFGTKR